VLAREGEGGLGARSIAREAGVPIGTMYRQFPSAQAVIAELAQQIERRACEELAREGERACDAAEIARAIASAYTSETLVPLPVRHALSLAVPRRWTEEALMPLHANAVEQLAGVLARVLGNADADQLRLLAFFALHAARAVTDAYLLLEPPSLGATELTSELSALIERYLRAAGDPS
jgi:AcrR family transcriptional regulator